MRTKLATLFVLLASCCQGCRRTKVIQHGCNLVSIGPVTKGVLDTIKAMQNSKYDDKPFISLLKNFRMPCKKNGVDLPGIIDILDIYKTHVFSKLGNNEKFMVPLVKVQDTLEHCLEKLSANPHFKEQSFRTKNIKKLRKTFKRLDTSGLYKAVLEFKTVLVWLRWFQHAM